jgi:hypothetical protein
LGRRGLDHFTHGNAGDRVADVRGEVGQWGENESALRHARVRDFELSYSGWMQKMASEATASRGGKEGKSASKNIAKPQAAKPAPSAKGGASAKDNPYKRPFGRMTVQELEREIQRSEKSIAEYQERFAAADSFRDPSGAKKLHEEYDELTKKLEALEAEYFARET